VETYRVGGRDGPVRSYAGGPVEEQLVPGAQELIVIAIVALLVFGPERLPELARTAARTLAKVRNEAARNVRELREATEIAELERELRDIRGEFTGTRDQLRREAGKLVEDEPPSARDDDRPPPTDLEAT
jgi:sec-independent protein translocase protein TatB